MSKKRLFNTKPNKDYDNNMQREMTIAEWNLAKELYYQFETWFNNNLKEVDFNNLYSKLRHNAMCSIERQDEEYCDFIYGNEQELGIAIFLSICHTDNKPYICTNFDVFVKGLDYGYNWDIDISEEDIEIIEVSQEFIS